MKKVAILLSLIVSVSAQDNTAPTMTITALTSTPEVTTFAGTGSSGSTNGTGTAASFNYRELVSILGCNSPDRDFFSV